MIQCKNVKRYEEFLEESGLSHNTIILYVARAKEFLKTCKGWETDKRIIVQYVEQMQEHYKPRTVNLYIISMNHYLKWSGYQEYTVRTRRIQAKRSLNNILSLQEYFLLLEHAKKTGRIKYYMIMKVLAGTGIRVSELGYFTIAAIKAGNVDVYNKGKTREIYIPESLSKLLLEYSREQQIEEGILFEGAKGRPISRNAVWQMLTKIAEEAGIDKRKANPHSFRHLFAKTYMNKYGNLAELGDILGHASLETTRIYTTSTVEENRDFAEEVLRDEVRTSQTIYYAQRYIEKDYETREKSQYEHCEKLVAKIQESLCDSSIEELLQTGANIARPLSEHEIQDICYLEKRDILMRMLNESWSGYQGKDTEWYIIEQSEQRIDVMIKHTIDNGWDYVFFQCEIEGNGRISTPWGMLSKNHCGKIEGDTEMAEYYFLEQDGLKLFCIPKRDETGEVRAVTLYTFDAPDYWGAFIYIEEDEIAVYTYEI